MAVLRVEDGGHPEATERQDRQPQDDGRHAVPAPHAVHRRCRERDPERSRPIRVETERLHDLVHRIEPLPTDESRDRAAAPHRFADLLVAVQLAHALGTRVRHHCQCLVDQGDRVDAGLPRHLFHLALHADLLPEVEDVGRVGMHGDDPGEAARADGDAEEAALPEAAVTNRGWNVALGEGWRPSTAPHVHHHGVSWLRSDFHPGWLPHHPHHRVGARGRRRVRTAVPIEEIDAGQAVHRANLVEPRRLERTREQELVDQAGIVEQPLSDHLLHQAIAENRVPARRLERVGQRESLALELTGELLLGPPGDGHGEERRERREEQHGCDEVTGRKRPAPPLLLVMLDHAATNVRTTPGTRGPRESCVRRCAKGPADVSRVAPGHRMASRCPRG